jgi:demethylmenaquinone methyltransferase/2-methoxy-6-polyprenyl-1,4-benzoquinol methylase
MGTTDPTAPHPVLDRYYPGPGDREPFVTALFDEAAPYYDWVCRVMALGSGQRYRRQALERAGLRPAMKLLDVATGTGLVARSALRVVGAAGAITGIDPSGGMLREARRSFAGPLVQGRVEALPFGDRAFDLVSMGYALRHVANLEAAFGECFRVLRPTGRVLVLDISRPASPALRWLLRVYLQRVLPLLMGVSAGGAYAQVLTRYYWDTIAACVPPAIIVEVMRRSGFVNVERRVFGGCLTEYVAARPAG